MPKVKPLIRPDPRAQGVRKEIGSIMGVLQIDAVELSQISGINYKTLMRRIGKNGNIGDMRLYELWAIQDAAKRRGYENE